MSEVKSKEEIYENNRPKFHDWGTLKDMCIASMQQYADQQSRLLREENGELQEKLGQTEHDLEEKTKQSKQWCDKAMEAANQRIELQKEIERLKGLIRRAYCRGYNTGSTDEFKDRDTEKENWEQFQTDNNL
jgi:hypothetical protein